MNRTPAALILLMLAATVLPARSQPAPIQPAAPPDALSRMPVREVTVFKDGHAFVLHQGRLPLDPTGSVVMDNLPTPVLGTFWPYVADRSMKLVSVTASPRRVKTERPALSIVDLLEANPGAQVRITQTDKRSYDAQIIEIPRRPPSEEREAGPLPGYQGFGGGFGGFGPYPDPSGQSLRGNTVMLKTAEGVKAVPLGLIESVTFKGVYRKTLAEEEVRNLLSLKVERPAGAPERTADVGMVYLQKGIRWIPNYRLAIDGKGGAVLRLQATVINEMVDLENVTAQLVIGVPSFYFKDTPDPIALQASFPQLSRYFDPNSQTGFAFSNALMSQAGGFGGGGLGGGRGQGATAPFGRGGFCGPEEEPAPDQGCVQPAMPEERVLRGGDAEQNEDLYVFTVRGLTLKKGHRVVLPIAEHPVSYRDVYTLDLPFAAPPDVNRNVNQEQEQELARLLRAPRVQHKIRVQNASPSPFTTAPLLVVKGDRVVSQSLLTYTPAGSTADVTLTTAPDIRVTRTESEVRRTPNAANYFGTVLALLELEGKLTLQNTRNHPVEVEVTRYVIGGVSAATPEGRVERVSLEAGADADPNLTRWVGYYNWPAWWHQRNGISRVKWTVRLQPGESRELGYNWSYFVP